MSPGWLTRLANLSKKTKCAETAASGLAESGPGVRGTSDTSIGAQTPTTRGPPGAAQATTLLA